MDHELMTMWLSVDPMADKYPSISPYAYCNWNPVKLKDPDGMETIENDDGWKIDRHKKTITRVSCQGGEIFHNINDGGSSRFFAGSREDVLNEFDGFTLIDNVENDCDGAPLSIPQSSAESSQDGGGFYNPASTVLDGADGFSTGWGKTSHRNRNSIMHKASKMNLLGNTKPGRAKEALNAATTKGVLGKKCLGTAGAVVGVVDIGIGVIQDGGHFGVNAAGSLGSTAGGWVGARAGIATGVSIGAYCGPWGVAIGGLVGGIVGGLGGSLVGEQVGRTMYNHF
jgi:hypothetical protein